MRNVKKILVYTAADLMNRRSVYVALAFCLLFVLVLRGCFGRSITVNGQAVDPAILARHLSTAAFHLIACGSLLFACLLSMRLLGRDREDGTSVLLLSRPVHRTEYLAGRIGGVWIVSSLFMLLLHLSVVVLSLLHGGGPLPAYLLASLFCCLNLLCLSVLVCLLSLLLPDFLAAFTAVLVATVSFLSESVFQVMQGRLLQTVLGAGNAEAPVSLWRSLFPKIAGLQVYASSLLGDEAYRCMGPIPPAVNVLLYTALFTGLLLWRFHHEEL
jgi:ABC-type transport system involved in multi-copper enzyme maturation permease subunit